MNFQTKNFRYKTKPFSHFLDEIAGGSPQYLRSLSPEQPSKKPAEFASDFPELAADFVLPPQLSLASQNAHSSPLRISGPVNMWLHYDVSRGAVQRSSSGQQKLLLAYMQDDFPCHPRAPQS